MPFSLPTPLHHFSSKGLITDSHNQPDTIRLKNRQYQLRGCTLCSGKHTLAAPGSNLSGLHMIVYPRVGAMDPGFYHGH